MEEVSLCQFTGPGLKRMATSTSCLLGKPVASSEACVYYDHHTVRKPKLAMCGDHVKREMFDQSPAGPA